MMESLWWGEQEVGGVSEGDEEIEESMSMRGGFSGGGLFRDYRVTVMMHIHTSDMHKRRVYIGTGVKRRMRARRMRKR